MLRITAVIFLVILSIPAYGQNVKKQIYAGLGTTAGLNNAPSAINISSGFAVTIPINNKVFIRPFIGVNLINPTGELTAYLALQTAGLVGLKLTQNFSFLAGGGETMSFPNKKLISYTPVAIISTTTKLNGKLLLFTPITLNKKGIGTSIQLGFSW